MSALKQIRSVTALGLLSLPARFGTSMVVVIGVAAVVAVLVSALAMAHGFTRTAAANGNTSRAIVLSATTEAASRLSRQNVGSILNAPGVRKTDDNQPIGSAESLAFLPLADPNTGLNVYATVRGVGPEATRLRPEMKVIEGRFFKRGTYELMIGHAAQRRLRLAVGSKVSLPNGEWTVVGVFASGGDSHESELVTDAETLLNTYRRDSFNSLTVQLDRPGDLRPFTDALTADPTLAIKVFREDRYFAMASSQVSQLFEIIAYGLGAIMAFGAVFGALNTLYAAVSTRATEIATLRAIGFGASPVVVSVLIEAMLLALVGASIGAFLAWILLDEAVVSTVTGVSPSQVTFALQVSPGVMLTGVLFALAIAVIGGLAAAVRAARVSVASAAQTI